jgi:hypothetical protein
MDEELPAQAGHRDQAIGAGVGEADEQAETRDPGDAAGELRADAVGQEVRHIAIGGVALGGHGAALGVGDQLGRILHLGDVAFGQAVVAQAQRADQGAVDHEIRIAPDRRGEVRVAHQVEAEVAEIVRRIVGLHLGAQDHLVDDVGMGAVAGHVEQPVEALGAHGLALGPGDRQGGEEIHQGQQLHVAGRLVHAVDQGRALGLQGFSRADIGLDHHLLDEAVGLQRGARGDRDHLALGVDDDLPFGAFDGQRRAGVAPLLHRRVGGPERREDGVQQRLGRVVRLAVDRGLGLFVGELGRRAHQAAHEAMRALAPVGAEHHPHGQAGAVLAIAKRTEAVGQAFGQHRLHPVGEVDAVALVARGAVQGGVGADVGRDVGDGDPDDPAAGVARIVVGLGVDGVVVVAGVGRVDGDQGNVAQVLAAGQGRRLGGLGLGLGLLREAHGDAVGVDGDQRGGPRLILAPHHLQQLAALGAIAALRRADLGQHQIPVAQVLALMRGQDQGLLGAAVHRLDPDLAALLADHAQHAVRALAQALDETGLEFAGLQALEADQQAVAQAGRAGHSLMRRGGEADQGGVLALGQPDEQLAVGIALDHVDHADGRDRAGLGQSSAAPLAQGPGFLQLAQHLAQRLAIGAFKPEDPGDLGLVGLSGVADERDQGGAVRQPLGGARRGRLGGEPSGLRCARFGHVAVIA